MRQAFGAERILADSFSYVANLVNDKGAIVGIRAVNRDENIYIDVPVQHFIRVREGETVEERINSLIDCKIECDINAFSFLSRDCSKGIAINFLNKGKELIVSDDLCAVNDSEEYLSFIYPKFIVRILTAYQRLDTERLKSVFDFIYGTEFLDVFNISKVSQVNIINGNVTVGAHSRYDTAKLNCEAEWGEMAEAFLRMKEFQKKYSDYFAITSSGDRFNILIQPKTVSKPFRLDKDRTLPRFQCGFGKFECLPNCYKWYYFENIERYRVTQTIPIDNPFGVKVQCDKTDKVDHHGKSLTDGSVCATLRSSLNQNMNIFKDFVMVRDNIFVALEYAEPYFSDEFIKSSTDFFLDNALRVPKMEILNDIVISSVVRHGFKRIDKGTIAIAVYSAEIDPDTFGEENRESLKELVKNSFENALEKDKKIGGTCLFTDNDCRIELAVGYLWDSEVLKWTDI